MPSLNLSLKLKKGESSADAIMRMLSDIGKEREPSEEFPGISEAGMVTEDVYTSKTDKEIKELALELYRGEIFTSLQLRDLESELSMVFMPLRFMDEIAIKILVESKVGMFYAKMNQAAPRCINGLPVFFGVSYINEDDTDRLMKKYNKVIELMEDL